MPRSASKSPAIRSLLPTSYAHHNSPPRLAPLYSAIGSLQTAFRVPSSDLFLPIILITRMPLSGMEAPNHRHDVTTSQRHYHYHYHYHYHNPTHTIIVRAKAMNAFTPLPLLCGHAEQKAVSSGHSCSSNLSSFCLFLLSS